MSIKVKVNGRVRKKASASTRRDNGLGKPIVYFGKVIGWSGGGEVQEGMRALLGDVTGHPRLGDEPEVNTNAVLRIERNEEGEAVEIETIYTIYRKREVTK